MNDTEEKTNQPEIIEAPKEEIIPEKESVEETSPEQPQITDFDDRISKLLEVVSKQQEQLKEITTQFKEKSEQLDNLQKEIDSKKPFSLKIVSFEGGADFATDKARILNDELTARKTNAKKILDSFDRMFA